MYKCDACGKKLTKKKTLYGYTACSKHMHQLLKYGKFLDNIQRTNNDLNDYEIKDDGVYFNVYNQRNEYVATFIVDFADIEKIKYHKWRMSHGHVVTGLPAQGTQRDVSHVVMNFIAKDNPGLVVDHINGNPLDNRSNNLRICNQSENVCNKSFISNNTSGYIGVSYRADRDRYDPEIRKDSIRCHLGYKKTLEEAVYARYIAEQLVFKEFANQAEQWRKKEFTKTLPEEVKQEIYNITIKKLQAKGLWP